VSFGISPLDPLEPASFEPLDSLGPVEPLEPASLVSLAELAPFGSLDELHAAAHATEEATIKTAIFSKGRRAMTILLFG
jgi:hypothetical protein